MSIDMTEVRQLFFEESFESLDTMESNLLDLQVGEADKDLINSIFRVVHSIKGGAGIFKFERVINFAHTAETLLDEIRSGQHIVTQNMIDTLLQAVDVLRMMLTNLQNDAEDDAESIQICLNSLQSFLAEPLAAPFLEDAPAKESQAESVDTTNTAPAASGSQASAEKAAEAVEQEWLIEFKPYEDLLKTGNDPINLFNELALLGTLTVQPHLANLPSFTELNPQNCYLAWTLTLTGVVSKAQIEEIFEWVEGDCELTITCLSDSDEASAEIVSTETESTTLAEEVSDTTSLETEASTGTPPTVTEIEPTPVANVDSEAPVVETEVSTESSSEAEPESTSTRTAADVVYAAHEAALHAPIVDADTTEHKPHASGGSHAQSAEASSIRVSIDKIDDLINIVGELVITQSMLDQVSENFDLSKLMQLRDGLAQLERNTRELQESVMRIRMLPISYSFNRFPRLVHDLSVSLGKKVELRMSGEHTELDKTVLEKMSDPLVHLVRNALDHGIEKPAERRAAGKAEKGLLHLHAFHQGGNIMIQISDDGAGFNMERIRQKAITLGLLSPDEVISDEQLYEFIFHPGFSTASQISDLSGRGVGMDVVRRNIRALGGSIEINSHEGVGTTFNIRLPLTLAILDGQLVRVGQEIYILSLLSIVESLRVSLKQVNSLAGKAEVYKLRDEYIPVLRLYDLFGIQNAATRLEEGLLVIVEGDGQKIGLFVDELLSQQQIVIKSLESNYKSVAGISGATILGDGSVALILDVAGLIKLSHTQHKAALFPPRHFVQESGYEYQH